MKKIPEEFLDDMVESEINGESDDLNVERVKLEIMKLFSHYNPDKTLSHLTAKERTTLARLETYATPFFRAEYKSKALMDYINNYLLYSVSLNREGRKEFVRIASSFYAGEVEDQDTLREAEFLRRALLR